MGSQHQLVVDVVEALPLTRSLFHPFSCRKLLQPLSRTRRAGAITACFWCTQMERTELYVNLPNLINVVWNVTAHAQKPDFVFRQNGRVHLNRRGRQFGRLVAAEVYASGGSNAGYNMFRGSVKGTGYPLHSPVSPSLPLPCVTVYHHVSTGLYPAQFLVKYGSTCRLNWAFTWTRLERRKLFTD
jgi:hypothetical protein